MNGKPERFSQLANFTPKQLEAKAAVMSKKYVLYGGAMGGGKSRFLRWILLYLLLHYFKAYGTRGVRVGLFCEDYPALKDRQISKIDMEFPAWLGTMNKTDHEFVLKPEYGAGVLCFRNLDDASKYQSSEFAAVGVDELTKNAYEMFMFLRTRMRWPGIPDTKFIAATNPGGIGHAWVKKMFLDGQFEPGEQEADLFTYVHAKASDNPHLATSYLSTLSGLTPEMHKVFVEGDWDIFKGQVFTEWRRELHVVEPHPVLPHWRKFVCGDYGYTAPSAIYWCYVGVDGKIVAYRELYETGLTFEQLMERVVAMTPPRERIDYMVFDPSIWAKGGKDRLSGAEIMEATYKRATDGGRVRLLQGNNDRMTGWRVMHDFLKPIPGPDGTVSAKFQVFSTCPELIRTLPALVYDKHRVEDVDSKGEDHAPDAIRYGIMSEPSATPAVTTGSASRLTRNHGPAQGTRQYTFD